jgi:hypothetical protein
LAPLRALRAVPAAAAPADLAPVRAPPAFAERRVVAAPDLAVLAVLVAPDLACVDARPAALRVLVAVALAPEAAVPAVFRADAEARLAAGLAEEDRGVDDAVRLGAGMRGAPH